MLVEGRKTNFSGFNPTRVRLKRGAPKNNGNAETRFNPTRVRLKQCDIGHRDAPDELQPHEGSSETGAVGSDQ